MRVRPRPLDSFPHGRSHDAERSPRRIAISKQARGKLCHSKNLRVGIPHDDSVIKTRDNYAHFCILSSLDQEQGICYYPNVKRVTANLLSVKYLNIKFYHYWEECMADAIDKVIDQWRRERPEVDIWPMSILGRILRLSRVLEREYKKLFAEHGLEPFEYDVLTTLRRAGEPYELTASALLKAALVTSGAITNRIDRMEVKGLVERVRDRDDRRSVHIRLTPHERDVLDAIFGLHIANMERILDPLDLPTHEQLAQG